MSALHRSRPQSVTLTPTCRGKGLGRGLSHMSRSWCRRSRFIGEPVEPRPAPNVILSVAKNLGQWPVSRLRRSCLLTFQRGGFETCPLASPKRSPVWGPFRSPRTAKRTPSPYSSLVKGEEGWVTVYDDFLCKAVLVRAVGEERRSKDRDVDQAPHAEGNRGRGAAGQEHPQSPPSEVLAGQGRDEPSHSRQSHRARRGAES